MEAQKNKKMAEITENISDMKRLLKIKTYKMTFPEFFSGSFEYVARTLHASCE